jgi:hypothetical protein
MILKKRLDKNLIKKIANRNIELLGTLNLNPDSEY